MRNSNVENNQQAAIPTLHQDPRLVNNGLSAFIGAVFFLVGLVHLLAPQGETEESESKSKRELIGYLFIALGVATWASLPTVRCIRRRFFTRNNNDNDPEQRPAAQIPLLGNDRS